MAATLCLPAHKSLVPEDFKRPETISDLYELANLGASIMHHVSTHLAARDGDGWEIAYRAQCQAGEAASWIGKAKFAGEPDSRKARAA